jgi:DNA invertase Pin-like site-specific DNA recombinase
MAIGKRRTRRNTDETRVVLYTRVSTVEQADSGLGLQAQELALRAECERRSWNVAAVFTDAGVSGKTLAGRPGLAASLQLLDDGEANCLAVAKLDRLSRSLLDFAGLMARAQRDGWNLIALDLGIDLSTPAGEFMASVMASAAQWERRIIGQRTKDALAIRRAEGVRLGRPSVLAPSLVARIVDARREGCSYRAIAKQLNTDHIPTAHGGLVWHPATVRSVVHSQAVLTNELADSVSPAPTTTEPR